MGAKNSKNKVEQVIYYYVFQKRMNKYLNDWKNKKDKHNIKIGYLVHPEWIKVWKNKANYEIIKKHYLDFYHLAHSKEDNNPQVPLIKKYIKGKIKNFNLNYLIKNNNFIHMINERNLSLAYLENFINEKNYTAFNINRKTSFEKIEYF